MFRHQQKFILIAYLIVVCIISNSQVIQKHKHKEEKEKKIFSLSFYSLKVGSTLSTIINIPPVIRKERPKAYLFVTAADVDDLDEIAIQFNGKTVKVPDELVDSSLRRSCEIEMPLKWVKDGDNKVSFTFKSNLNNTTGGFVVYDVKILIKY